MIQNQEATYKKVSALVDAWLDIHKGETFDLDIICRHLEAVTREGRQLVAIKLSNDVKRGKLEKLNRIYRYIDNTYKLVNWLDANEEGSLPIKWPYGREDDSRFGFDGSVVVSPGDIIVIAGTSNMGKTSFCLNFLWDNMDNFPCVLMGNEYTPVRFKRRVRRMTWADPVKGDGTPKFELIERHENWKDIIRPDYINIIDWINLEDNFYKIGSIIEGIQSKLNKGIALISLQKSPEKQLGLGGGFSQHLASLYLSIDYQRMTVIKAKEWFEHNPNNEMYGFVIVNGGTAFHNIRKIKKCPQCYSTGKSKGSICERCSGSGYIDMT